MTVLSVRELCKSYPQFQLDHISFELKKGEIMGFIGRNGAGKTTTLKSLLNFVHPESGEIYFFDRTFAEDEFHIKQRIGYVSGGIEYYKKKKLKVITDVTRRFYNKWDEESYQKYMQLFKLDENKTPDQLSAGMKVKYALVLALSHHAELLILDEPTSGLDPVSRDELLEIFLNLADEGISILFSTHITSDLDKCADSITYIQHGQIIASMDIEKFINRYKVIEISKDELTDQIKQDVLALKRSKKGYTALIDAEQAPAFAHDKMLQTDLESIMIHLEKRSDEVC